MTEDDWRRKFADCGAFWQHDGNPKRPYARLTTNRISDGFFNGGRVAEEDPATFSEGTRTLMYRFQELLRHELDQGQELKFPRIIGAEYGGIALSVIFAAGGRYKSAFAQKQPDDTLAFLRADIKPGERILIVEDTITTGGTVLKLVDAVRRLDLAGCDFIPTVYTLCNRSGKDFVGDFQIVSLISPNFTAWKEGENPFTPDGTEIVPPVRPKTDWTALTRDYE